MPGAEVDEMILEAFCVDADGFRRLDALLRQHGDDQVTYVVGRQDAVRYETASIDDVVSEANGPQTRILFVSATLRTDDVSVSVGFSEGVRLTAGSDDRSKVLPLISDLRNLIRDRFRGRGSDRWHNFWSFGAACVVGILAFTAYIQLSTANRHQNSIHYEHAVNSLNQRTEEATERSHARTRLLTNADALTARRLVHTGSISSKLDFLLDRTVTLEQEVNQPAAKAHKQPQYPETPWYFESPLVFLGAPALCALLAFLIAILLVPGSEAVFLMGAEVDRHARRSQRRERIVWGVGVALLVSVVASIIATLVV